MIGKGPKHILISEILGQETFKRYFKMKTLVSKLVLIRILMSLSVFKWAYPWFYYKFYYAIRYPDSWDKFTVKESFAYRYHERFLFKLMFKCLLTQNFRY